VGHGLSPRHARACRGHPRLMAPDAPKTWMAGTWPGHDAGENVSMRYINGRLFHLDVGGADHPAPPLGLLDDDLPPFLRRQRHRLGAELGEPRLDVRIIETGIDLSVERRDDVPGRAARRADAVAQARVVAGHGLADGRHLRERGRTLRGRDP